MPIAPSFLEQVRLLYTQPARYYHTFAHVESCLRELAPVQHLLNNPEDVRLALLFHDAIYDTHLNDNEERSAMAANLLLERAGLPEANRKRIVRLILATKHDIVLTDNDSKYIADIDLASLGLPWPEFNKNSQRIRQEYGWVDEDAYRRARVPIMRKLLTRPQGIYYTSYFKNKYGAQAAMNLERHISDLMSGH